MGEDSIRKHTRVVSLRGFGVVVSSHGDSCALNEAPRDDCESSGAVAHWIGVDVLDTTPPAPTSSGRSATVSAFDNGMPFDRISKRKAQNLLGEVLYAALLPDGLVKIGWTKHLSNRLYRLGRGTTLLAFSRGDFEDEQAVHHSLASSVDHGREYYRVTDEVIALVNDWRSAIALPAWQP